ncbi:MAG TPA: hypothetical protein VEA38_00905 [Terriglobales bacterium]|nr:hypothetical protein [Terriglobales bacterium]
MAILTKRDGQEVQGFLGVNLRQDRVSLADAELAKAINADLHAQPGVIVLRAGRTKQNSTALADQTIRRLARINSVRYRVAANSVYRGADQIINGLSTNLYTTLMPFRPLNDTAIWAFIADDGLMRKDDGTNTRKWGIAAPTATPSVGTTGTGLTGVYSVKYTYARVVGSAVAHESNPSPASANQTLTNQNLSISGLTASSDPQVTHVRIYRTVAGGSEYLFDQQIANGTTTATSSQADTALGDAVETDNDVPPDAGGCVNWNDQAWIFHDPDNPHYLWRSKRFRPESVPAANYLEIGNADDPIMAASPMVGLLGVLTRRTKYRVVGSEAGGYLYQEAISKRGTPAGLGVKGTEAGTLFVARDGVFLTNFIDADQELSAKIARIFNGESVNGISAINWDAASTISVEAFKNRYYVALPTGSSTTPDVLAVYSRDTRNWYFYDHPVRSLLYEEDTDDLTAGFTDGFVYVLEDGTTDAGSDIELDVETKDYFGGSPKLRKLFLYAKVDLDTDGDTVTLKLYVDGVLKRTITGYSSSRGKALIPFPEECMGFTWRIALTYTGRKAVKWYGAGALWAPLEAA